MPQSFRPVLLALLALFLVAPALAGPGETKVFKDQNFELTPPEHWQWLEVSSSDQQLGYVARLGRRAAGGLAIATIRVAPTNGLSVREITQEIQSFLGGTLESQQGSRIDEGALSGLKGTALTLKGAKAGDIPVLIKVWSIEHGGKFHQLFVEHRDGAEQHLAGEVENLRRGYRLLQGAGPKEDFVDPQTWGKGDAAPEGGSAGGAGEAAAVKGGQLEMEALNLRWKIPAGTPFEIENTGADVSSAPTGEESRLVARFRARTKRADDEAAQPNAAVVALVVRSSANTRFPNEIATDTNIQRQLGERFFDRVDFGRTQVLEDFELGNYKGAALEMIGTAKQEGENAQRSDIVTVRLYWVRLRDLFYEWLTVIQGDRTAAATLEDPRNALMQGIEFLETVEAAIGPVGVPSVPPSNRTSRATDFDKETEIISVGLEAEKPEFMGKIDFDPQHGTPNLRLAWEMRSEDKQKYLYFDVQSFPYEPGMRDPEQQLVEQREGQWRQVVESAQTKNRRDETFKKDRWGRAKGLSYEFTGTFNNQPMKELGWVVRYKDYLYYIRIQLGGADAEDAFKKEIKKLERSLKF